jgi:replicative DNA helicase
LQDALGVGFDNSVGHDYINDAESRFEYYHRVENRIAFDLEMFNKITNGGLPNKTLNVALAGTGVGKSLFMCHVAAACLSAGKNVLYITLEMAEEKIAERIDANLMNLPMDQLHDLPKQMFSNRIDRIKDKTEGRLFIKEYPTAGANASHFKALINELSLKQKFRPDMIMIDYLNICASSRFKGGANINSYTLVKSIAEELRGLAIEHDVPILTATQTTRSGFSNTDVELTDTSESFGLPATADLMFALISTEELEALNQLMVKQLKNRYNDPTVYRKFIIGIDRARMKLYDVEARAQQGLSQSGQDDDDDYRPTNRKLHRDFSSIKV